MISMESFVAGLAALVGGLVWFTTHQQFKLQLFEKRWAIYSRMRQILEEFARNAQIDPGTEREFARLRHQTKYLFGRTFPNRLKIFEDEMLTAMRLDKAADRIDNNEKLLLKSSEHFQSAVDFIKFESIFNRGLSVDDSPIAWLANWAVDRFKPTTL